MTGRCEQVAAETAGAISDECLVKQFNDRDGAAFDKLVERYLGDVSGLASRLLGWDSEVEDVVQDVFLAAFMGLKKFRFKCSVKTWLFGITINKCRSYKYRRAVHRKLLLKAQAIKAASEKKRGREEKHEQVRQAVRRLPVKYREAVVLKYLQGLSTKEIIEVLGVTESAFHTRLSRARERLEKELTNIDTVMPFRAKNIRENNCNIFL
jgi:RNA polymerase sigma-70 factor (ECF subfamily)